MCTCVHRCLGRTRYISLVLFAIGITNRYTRGWAAATVLFFLLGTALQLFSFTHEVPGPCGDHYACSHHLACPQRVKAACVVWHCGCAMEQHGNKTTFNIETVLRKNIVDSEYWRNTCAKLQTWEEIVDQIFYDVDHVEPWMSGNARGASSAFGLLYRLAQIQPSEEQVEALLTHEDSCYIRAVGRVLSVVPSRAKLVKRLSCRSVSCTLDILETRSSCGAG